MKSVQVAALAALLFEGAQAVPMAGHHHGGLLKHAGLHRKRDIVWVTSWEIETVTVMRTVTAGQEPATSVVPATYSVPAPVTTTSAPAAYPTVPSPSETGTTSVAPVQSSTSVYVPPPAPTTTTAAPPPPATTTAAPTSSAAAYTPPAAPVPVTTTAPVQSAAPTYSSAPSSGGDGKYIGAGDATNYTPGMGACGNNWDGVEDIVAISDALFTANLNPANTVNPNDDLACGKMVNIKGVDGTIYPAKIDDRCMGCKGMYDLDMPLSLFNKVTNNGDGRVGNIGWSSTFDFKIPS